VRGKFRADTIGLFRKPCRQPKAYAGFGNLLARRPTSCTTISYKVAKGEKVKSRNNNPNNYLMLYHVRTDFRSMSKDEFTLFILVEILAG
jgi:hypothetical protein